jgi:hypothetical protein
MGSDLLRAMLSRYDPLAPAFIEGDELIAQAASFRDVDNFAARYMTQVCCRSRVADGIESIHTRFGHCWSVRGRPFTHPNSAAVWGTNIRNYNQQMRRASVPGWFDRPCLVSSGSAAL